MSKQTEAQMRWRKISKIMIAIAAHSVPLKVAENFSRIAWANFATAAGVRPPSDTTIDWIRTEIREQLERYTRLAEMVSDGS